MPLCKSLTIAPTAIALQLILSASAWPAAEVKLQGTVQLDAEACAKGTGGAECSVTFSISGKAAKLLYDGMAEKGAMQECTGNVEKFNDSGMHCIKGKTAADYLCDFGYYFKQHRFGAGPDGC